MNTTNTLTAAEVLTKAVAYGWAEDLGEAAMNDDTVAAEVQRRLATAVRQGFAFYDADGRIGLTWKGEAFVAGR